MTQNYRKQEFGRRLRRFMEEAGMSSTSLMFKSNVSSTTITESRRGVYIPSRQIARRLAIALEQSESSFDDLYLPDNLEDEEWRPLKRHPEYYGSSRGRILNPNTGRIMKVERDKYGRPKIQLHIHGKPYTARAQDLIDETFEDG